MSNNQALLLDVDHTVIKPKSGNTFPEDEHDWRFIGEILPFIRRKFLSGYKVVFVTNQAGVAYGYTTKEELKRKFDRMRIKLARYLGGSSHRTGITKGEFPLYMCTEKESYYRKPNPGMIYQAALDHKLDLKNSVMIGDSETDEEAANNASVGKFYYINQILVN